MNIKAHNNQWTTDQINSISGKRIYGPDFLPEGSLHAVLLHSPYPHAKILNISLTKAERIPGVKAILTGKHIPDRKIGLWVKDMPLLAQEKVRYVGEPVAIVAAETLEIAKLALNQIAVEYEELPPLFEVIDAANSSDILIHEGWQAYDTDLPLSRKDNICSHTRIGSGDVAEGFKKADLIFEHTYQTPIQHQAYIEPHASTVEVQANGVIKIWTSTDNPTLVREQVHFATGIPLAELDVIPTKVGGGFGGKEVLLEPLLVLLAQKTNQCVHLTLSREEEFLIGNPRHSSVIKIKTGVKENGEITARQATIYLDTGAYADQGPGLAAISTMFSLGPYKIPNLLVDAYCVYTNHLAAGSYRDTSNPQGTFAGESQLDLIATELHINPIELRRLNLISEGDPLINGQILPLTNIGQILELSEGETNQDQRLDKSQLYGKGTALMLRPCGPFPLSLELSINKEGELVIHAEGFLINETLSKEIVQKLKQIFYVDDEKIKITFCGETEVDITELLQSVEYCANQLFAELHQTVSKRLEENLENITYKNGTFFIEKGVSSKSMSFEAVLSGLATSTLTIRKSINNSSGEVSKAQVVGLQPPKFEQYAAAALSTQIRIDPGTGKFKLFHVQLTQESPTGFFSRNC